VARNPQGKVIFVEGALPGEDATVRVLTKRKSFDLARVVSFQEASPSRVDPKCAHFGTCGGCALQHTDLRTQVAAKQRWLEDSLARIGNVQPESLLAPLYGDEWGYRSRARFSARRVEKKGGVLVGFRERRSSYIVDMRECAVLPPHVSRLIVPLRELAEKLSIRARLPQVELAIGDNATVLVVRHLDPLTDGDSALLRHFAQQNQVHVWLQAGGPETAHPFEPVSSELHYTLPDFGVKLHFRPTDFTQVNQGINRALVSRAVRLLDPQAGERIGDLFCGLGNFSLPIATRGASVIGFEGSRELVQRARANATANGLVAQFEEMNLFAPNLAPYGPFDKLLLDPPREGAIEVVKGLGDAWPGRIVYVSCDPATLARDAAVLAHTKGFRLVSAGVVNMFPHTAHVESIALFERGQ
jgi:23S rRNA (uracil1939-C5)-methyltransferase